MELKNTAELIGLVAGGGLSTLTIKIIWDWLKNNGATPVKAGCGDEDCHDKLIQASTDIAVIDERVDKLETGQTQIFDKLDSIPQDIVTLLKTTGAI